MGRKSKENEQWDEEELDEAYYQLTGRKPSGKGKKSSILVITVCGLLMVAAISLVAIALLGQKKTLGNAEVAGIQLNGMTPSEAKTELEALAQIYERTSMQVTVMEQVISVSPDAVGVKLDVEGILDAAQTASSQGAVVKLDILQYLGLEEGKIWQLLMPLEEEYGITPSKTQWSVTGQAPDPQIPEDPGSKVLVVHMGVPDYGLDMDKLYQMVLQGYRQQNFHVTMNCDIVEPEKPDLEEIYSLTCTDAVDATMDEKTFAIAPESYGYGFDLTHAKALLADCAYGQTVEIPFAILEPKVTAQQLEAELYGDILGQCRTPHTNEANRNENLRLACEAINGLVLLPGETFSYNDALGERTEKKGYKPAASYVNGLTVDTVGGGICQVSSTLYDSCLLSDLEIVRRSPHSYVSSYIPKGLDAAVSWKSQDFKFKNNLSTPIRIKAWVEGGYVNVQIFGKETRSYYVELMYEELSTEPYDTVYRELPHDNEKGYTDGEIIITPYSGCTVKTYKKLYDRETGKLLETAYITKSTYNKRDKVICLIVEPTTPAPTQTVPETTPAPAETTLPETTPGETFTPAA